MPRYNFKARDAAGKLVTDTTEAATKEELIERLRRIGYMVTSVQEIVTDKKLALLWEKFRRPINTEDMILFNVELSNMINSGVTLLDSLNVLKKQIENKTLKETLGFVASSVKAGESLSGSVARYPHTFSKLFINMVKAGEASGKLGNVLDKLAQYLESQAQMKQNIKGIMLYPSIVFCFAILITLFLVTFIMPRFVEIFQATGVKLPLLTLAFFKIGMMIRQFWYLIILLIISAAVALRYYFFSERGGLLFDRLKLRMPIVGPLYRKIIISRFTSTLAILFSSGVPILESLDITRDVMVNRVYVKCLTDLHDAVKKGKGIAESLGASGEFPPDITQMVAVGEETGSLGDMLNKVADFYDRAIAYAIKKFTTILEPLLILSVGTIVAFILASMLIPVFSLVRLVSG